MIPSVPQTTGSKKKKVGRIASARYFGVKSVKSDEVVYYQMASVFRAVTLNNQDVALKLMDGILSRNRNKFLLENRL